MLMKVMLAVVIAVAACAVLAAHYRENGSMTKLAQYCLPQDDILGAPTIYC
jgi:hypothetical protein